VDSLGLLEGKRHKNRERLAVGSLLPTLLVPFVAGCSAGRAGRGGNLTLKRKEAGVTTTDWKTATFGWPTGLRHKRRLELGSAAARLRLLPVMGPGLRAEVVCCWLQNGCCWLLSTHRWVRMMDERLAAGVGVMATSGSAGCRRTVGGAAC